MIDEPSTVAQQTESKKYSSEDYLSDINTLTDIYAEHCPYKDKKFYYPEFTPKTDIVLPCESSVRTNIDVFTNGIRFLTQRGTAVYRQTKESMPLVKQYIQQYGLINFLNEYVDTYVRLMYDSLKDTELTEQLKVSIFLSAYCASLVDAILCMHDSDEMSGLTVLNEAIRLQLNIVDSVCNVRHKEFNVVEAGIRWGIDTSYINNSSIMITE